MAGQVSEPARQVDVVHETDVLVVGSGPGGLSAALASARAGAATTLLDRYGCFGGNLTQVGVEGIGWYRHEGTVEGEGIGRELEERAAAMGAANPPVTQRSGQGAGVAAAISLRDDRPFDRLDVTRVQAELRRQGVRLN